MYSIRLEGDTQAMLRKIRSFSEIDKRSINAALAEVVRESTLERFKQSRDPASDGRHLSGRQVRVGRRLSSLPSSATLSMRDRMLPALRSVLTSNTRRRTSSANRAAPYGRAERKPSVSRWAVSGFLRSKSASASRPVPSSASLTKICRRSREPSRTSLQGRIKPCFTEKAKTTFSKS